ncbi:uncharacterized protein L3040_000070 [Drepanopeziza brunnea f. sp. 'multigermtubi']|uniref:uncharacterized protein n=1 Tax=Drepanopeziza brunnea f. sp. 'multigermtubi' TaxID=698441 RepID=UPI002398C377|nr:hypothetical protein L3040_000070 [Drepanopeziza brunnea f. sp. 'multigermtubi']
MSFTNEQTSPKADPSSAAPSRSQQLNAFLFQLASAYASKDPTTIQAAQALLFGGLQIETKISEQRIAVQDYAAFAELFNKMFAVTAVINKRKTEIVSSAELKMPAMAGYCSGCGDCDESKEKGASESR